MTRITSWPRDARAAVVLCLGVVVAAGCLSGSNREAAPPLIITPSTAFQGEVLPLVLWADGLSLRDCTDDPGALRFNGPGNRQSITPTTIDELLSTQDSARAVITIDIDAPRGDYEVVFSCNETTTLRGRFRVEPLPAEQTLHVEPGTLSAGVYGKSVKLKTDTPFFTEDATVIFGTGEFVTITEQQLGAGTGTELAAVINIDPLAPLGRMGVTAMVDGRVAKGAMTVTDRIQRTVSIFPAEVVRQASGDAEAASYELIITGTGMPFVAPGGDDGDLGAPTEVSFPKNPGIRVVSDSLSVGTTTVGGEDVQVARVRVLVFEYAKLGPTPVRVANEDGAEAWTQMSVLLKADAPYLNVISPKTVPRNGQPTPVFAETINFDLESYRSLRCDDDQCRVSAPSINYQTKKSLSFDVTVDPAFPPEIETVELILETAEETASAVINVAEPDPIQLYLDPADATVEQGSRNETVRFSLSGILFPSTKKDVSVDVLPRSGLKIVRFDVPNTLDAILINVDVAEDAPTGPAYVRVTIPGHVLETPLPIAARAGSSSITCTPGATLRKRDIVLPVVRSDGFDLPGNLSAYSFDDPGLRVVGVTLNDDGSAGLTVDVSPRTRPDMAVLYVKGADGQAAATFRTFGFPETEVLPAAPPVVERGTENPTITISGDEIAFNRSIVVESAADIGMDVGRIFAGQDLVLDLSLGISGYGGFTGLVIKSDARTYLSLLQIEAGQDTSLTAEMNPRTIQPGVRSQLIEMALPPPMWVDESLLSVHPNLPGAYAAAPRPVDGSDRKMRFFLDVAYDLNETETSEIPIFTTANKGAAVGFLSVEKEPIVPLRDGETWEGSIAGGRTKTFRVVPDAPPTLVQVSFAGGAGEGTVSLIADNALDVAEKVTGGQLWITEQKESLIAVTPAPDDEQVRIRVLSRGREFVDENPETDQSGLAWSLVGADPCDTPFVGFGSIAGGLDTDTIRIGEINCELTAAILARRLARRPWDTPDLFMRLSQTPIDGETTRPFTEARNLGYPTDADPDPRLFISASPASADLEIGAELGTAGHYLVTIRRPHLIREISRQDIAFVELLIGPSEDLESLSLILVDADTGEVVESLDLVDAGVREGVMVISSGAMAQADLVHPVAWLPKPGDGDFALILKQGEALVDAVQVGLGNGSYGEGRPIAAAISDEVFARVHDIDTNDNRADFLVAAVPTPGR